MISDRKRHVLVLPIGFYVNISFVSLLIRRTQHIKFLGDFWVKGGGSGYKISQQQHKQYVKQNETYTNSK